KEAAAAIGKLRAADVAALRSGASIELALESGAVELAPEDVDVQVESSADFDVETDGNLVVYLDTELDRALRLEGLAREVVNRINGLRKDRGLAVEQRVRLRLTGEGELLADALTEHRDFIAAECLAVDVEVERGAVSGMSEWPL